MRTIHKYQIDAVDRQIVKMPEGGNIISVQVQHEAICLWAMVDTDRPLADRQIRITGTGHPIGWPLNVVHLGTVQLLGGDLVLHVFEAPRWR